jgi:hypothetical protein
MYEDACMIGISVRRCVKHFLDGNADIADQPRCGRAGTAATKRNIQKVELLIRENRRITVREIAAQLGVVNRAVQEMIEIFQYQKFFSRWVPRLLTEDNKTAEKYSPIHTTGRIWPAQTTTCLGP